MILIDINGIDNVGKTCLIDRLVKELQFKNKNVHYVGGVFSMLTNARGYSEAEWFLKTPVRELVAELAYQYTERYKRAKSQKFDIIILDRGERTIRASLTSRLRVAGFSRMEANKIVSEHLAPEQEYVPRIEVMIKPESLMQVQDVVGEYPIDYLKYQRFFFNILYTEEESLKNQIVFPAFICIKVQIEKILKEIEKVEGK
ncbi:hypothetical protein LQW06_000497 [Listeria monocytogenes]|nr:hypothetical protein [Listeria monocytogenes]EIO5735586.1 hypothetical protein [Listeria monocytogenes]